MERYGIVMALLAVGCGATAKSPPAASPTPVSAAQAQVDPDEGKGALLWRVEGKTGPVWLYGTQHLAMRDVVPEMVWEKLDASSTFVMEADISSLNPFALVKRAQLPADQSLDTMMGAERWEKMTSKVGDKFPAPMLKRFKPWFATMIVMLGMLSGDFQMDVEMANRAKGKGAKLVYLESAEEQLALLETSTTLDDLNELIDEYDAAKKEMDDLAAAYRDGDVARLKKIVMTSEFTDEANNDALLRQRNEKWIPTIEGLIKEDGNVFIAVGAAHLIGEHGVPTLLRKRGFTVERWPTPR